jgi:Holliday junction resolvasome RuvABC endonuclease subunit
MRVLAFDASSTTGWAFFASPRARPVLGHFDLPATASDYGTRSLAMQGHVARLIDEHHPNVIAFEAPIFLPRDRWHTRRLLTSLVVVIELVAAMRGLRCIEIDPSGVKEALCGPQKRNQRSSKDDMVVAAVNMGWKVANDHQADACGVAVATYAHLERQRVPSWA